MLIRAGLTAIVIIFATALVFWIMNHKKPVVGGPPAGEARAISVAVQDKLIKDNAGKPKVVLSMYEDFLCPHCGEFEQKMGATVGQLIDAGAVQADYYMVALPPLDTAESQHYSSRAGNAAYCVADADTSPGKDAFRRFHAALYAQQPGETSATFPTDAQLIETAREAGVASANAERLHQRREVHGDGAGPGEGHRHPVHADDPRQRRSVRRLGHHDTAGPDQQGHADHRSRPGTGRSRSASGVAGPGARSGAWIAGPDPRGAVTVEASSPAPAAEGRAGQDARVAGVRVQPASAWWVLIAGVAGLVAALTLTVEKVTMLSNPSYVPSCSINPVLSCGSVMVTPQASAFGFPNPLIGIVGFTVVVVTGVLAVGRTGLPRWYWLGLAGGTTLLGVVFVHWLIFQSLYRIGALCPYCMVVWAVTIPLLVVVSSIALQPLGGNAFARVLYQLAVVAGGAVVRRPDSADPGAILVLLVDPDLVIHGGLRVIKSWSPIAAKSPSARSVPPTSWASAPSRSFRTRTATPTSAQSRRVVPDRRGAAIRYGRTCLSTRSSPPRPACGADAIYPGYGFLSENPELAAACAEAGITFVGPSAQMLELTGNKARAIAGGTRRRAAGADVLGAVDVG